MSLPVRRFAVRQGIGRPAGGDLPEVLSRCPLLPSNWGGQDVLAAWARGGPETAAAVERAVAQGVAARVWGPRGELWLAEATFAEDVRRAWRPLEAKLDGVDPRLVAQLRDLSGRVDAMTVGRLAGILGCRRDHAGDLLKLGSVQGWLRPVTRDQEGRLQFVHCDTGGDPSDIDALVVSDARVRVVDRLVATMGPWSVAGLAEWLGWSSAVVAEALRETPQESGDEAGVPEPSPGLALVGRGDPFVAFAATNGATERLTRSRVSPPAVILDGALVGVWSERWVRRSLHVDVAVAGTLAPVYERTLDDRVASLGRLRCARTARWRRLAGIDTTENGSVSGAQ